MDHGTLALLIPLAPFILGGIAIWTKHQRKIAEMHMDATAGLSAEKAAQYATHTAELEERVRVLERIVTDKGYDIATQIEALRDTARVEQLLDRSSRDLSRRETSHEEQDR